MKKLGKKALIVLYILILLIFGYMINVIKILSETHVVYIGIFDTVISLPNDYAINANSINNELVLLGDKGKVVIGSGDIESKVDFFKYVKSKSVDEKKECNINIIKALDGKNDMTLFYNKNSSIFLVNVKKENINNVLSVICSKQ